MFLIQDQDRNYVWVQFIYCLSYNNYVSTLYDSQTILNNNLNSNKDFDVTWLHLNSKFQNN